MRNPWETTGNFFLLTRRAKTLGDRASFEAFRLAQLLPLELLHPSIIEDCLDNFRRQKYSASVRDAFVRVEHELRESSPEVKKVNGSVPAARKAFQLNVGPLTDKTADPGEQDGVMQLFAGALGYYRDAHTLGKISDPVEAGQILAFASNLLRIIDRRLGRAT